MTTTVFQCLNCKRLHPGDAQKCDAFPDGIPDEIWVGKTVHDRPIEGDHGLQYKRRSRHPGREG